MTEQTRQPGASEADEFVITTLAEYQTAFWIGVARRLIDQGRKVSLISFDDNSTRMLRSEGFTVYTVEPAAWRSPLSDAEVEAKLIAFGVADTPYWYTHEKAAFRLTDEAVMDQRLCRYLGMCAAALDDVRARGNRPIVIQELGGFLSVIAAFAAARRIGATNWFIEPAFFKGRCFWLADTFSAKRIGPGSPTSRRPEATAYLEQALAQRTIVVPTKDAHQYASPARKVFTLANARRLAGKLIDRYLLGKRQEFGHIGAHVSKQLETVWAVGRLKGCYTPLTSLNAFVYYPLHVPGDMALTLRSAAYLDQLALIEAVARQLPRGHALAIKEHPAMIGALGARRLKELLKRNANVVLIDPSTNNYDVMARASAIVSVNSKSGAEALLLDRPVLVMGDSFYRGSGLTIDIDSVGVLKPLLAQILADPPRIDPQALQGFFGEVWSQSLPGELYVTSAEALNVFTGSLLQATEAAACSH